MLQIWNETKVKNEEPTYQQKDFSNIKDKLILVVSPDGKRDSLIIKQDVKIYKAVLPKLEEFQYKVNYDRHIWIQVVKGSLKLNDYILLEQGDGVAITEGGILSFATQNDTCDFLIFDLP